MFSSARKTHIKTYMVFKKRLIKLSKTFIICMHIVKHTWSNALM